MKNVQEALVDHAKKNCIFVTPSYICSLNVIIKKDEKDKDFVENYYGKEEEDWFVERVITRNNERNNPGVWLGKCYTQNRSVTNIVKKYNQEQKRENNGKLKIYSVNGKCLNCGDRFENYYISCAKTDIDIYNSYNNIKECGCYDPDYSEYDIDFVKYKK